LEPSQGTSSLNRLNLHPSNGRARCLLSIILGSLLIAASTRALAEEEPAAMAPLPPPLPFAPSAAGAPEVRTETVTPTPERDRTLAGVRRQPNPGAAHSVPGVRRVERKRSPHSKPGADAATSEVRHQGRRAIALSGKLGSYRASIGHDAGRLSPPEYDSAAGIKNAAMPPMSSPRIPVPYYPDRYAGPLGDGYLPTYRHPWPQPGTLGLFRQTAAYCL
jgi:hypothetical protein